MPHLLDHLLFVALAVLFPLRAATFGFRRLQEAPPDDVPRVRLALYRQILWLQWGLAAGVALLWIGGRRPWRDLGLVPLLNGALAGVAVGVAIVIAILAIQQRRAKQDDGAWERLRRRMEKIERILPRTPRELRWFEAVSVTAGVCEELLYRGFMIWYLSHWMAVIPAAAAAAALFGAGHVYQGLAGVVRTGALGAFLAAVYLLSGSLFMSMFLHFLVDFHSGRVMYEAYRRQGGAVVAGGPQPAADASGTT